MVPAEAFPVPLFFCRTIIPCRRSLCRWRSVFHWNNWSKILPVFQNHWHLPGWSMGSGIPDVLKVFPEARQSNEPELFPEEHRQTCWRDTVPNLFQTGWLWQLHIFSRPGDRRKRAVWRYRRSQDPSSADICCCSCRIHRNMTSRHRKPHFHDRSRMDEP